MQLLTTARARNRRMMLRRDALDLGPMGRLAIPRIADQHTVRIQRMQIAFRPGLAHRIHRTVDPPAALAHELAKPGRGEARAWVP